MTCRIGFAIASVFLGQYRPFFSRVIAFTRNAQSEHANRLKSLGAIVHELPASSESKNLRQELNSALKSIDVVIDVLNHEAEELAGCLFEASLEQSVPVYIPSEFGM